MALTLHDSLDFGELVNDFLELPDTLILFLKKIKNININISYPDGHSSELGYSFQHSAQGELGKLTILSKGRQSVASSQETIRTYHITRRLVTNLPAENARRFRNPSGACPLFIDKAEVALAFPIDDESMPIIEQQWVFAFLPLRRVGFNVSNFHLLP